MAFITATDRYIAKLVIGPTIGTFVLAASLLVLDKMNRLFDFVANAGGPVGVVFKMLANMMPEYMGLAIPLGLMMGVLLAFRKLATTSELDVMRALGLSYTRLLRVPFMLTIVLAALNLVIVGYVQPLSRYYYERLSFELTSGALGASIKVGEFSSLKDRMALRIETSADEGRVLNGIFVRMNQRSGGNLVISARRGQFLATSDSPDTIILRLTDGEIIQKEPNFPAPRVLTFSHHDLPIDLPRVEEFRQRGNVDREYILPELLRIGWNRATPREARAGSIANLNFRLVEVAMMFFLPFLAVALAVPPKRSTSALGVFLSIVMVVAYHKVNQYGQDIATLGKVNPILALWGPFVIFGAIIMWMYWRLAYVPGGQPIAALEIAFSKFTKMLSRLVPSRRKRSEAAVAA